MRIGSAEGQRPYLFTRIVTAFLLNDGRVAVADDGTAEIRYFNADGVHLRSVGGRGEGPGEFRALTAVIRLKGDTLLVQDLGNQRVTTISPEGVVLDELSVAELPGLGRSALVGRLSEDTFLFRSTAQLRVRPGFARDTMSVTIARLGDSSQTEVLRLPAAENLTSSDGSRRVRTRRHPFAHRAIVVDWDGVVVAGSGESYEYGVFDKTGRLQVRVTRTDVQPSELRDAAIDEYVRAYEAAVGPGADARSRFDGFPEPWAVPAYSSALIDDTDLLWIGDFVPEGPFGDLGPRSWTVFDRSHDIVARVEMPNGFRPFQITAGFVIGQIIQEDTGVPFVMVYRLLRT